MLLCKLMNRMSKVVSHFLNRMHNIFFVVANSGWFMNAIRLAKNFVLIDEQQS